MATQSTMSIGSRSTNAVTVNTVTGTNPYTVTLSAAVPAACKVGDKILDSATNSYLITAIATPQLTVGQFPFNAGTAPVTGAATLSRAFVDPNAWNAAAPANLTTATVDGVAGGVLYKGEAWNDAEFAPSVQQLISGSTSSATCFKWLSVAATQSFADNAGKLTNALTYNVANGVGLTPSHVSGSGIFLSEAFAKMDRWQVRTPFQTSVTTDGAVCIGGTTASVSVIGNILQTSTNYSRFGIGMGGGATTAIITNNVIIFNGGGAGTVTGGGITLGAAGVHQVHNNTIVCCSDKAAGASSGNGIFGGSSTTSVIKNNAVFGFGTAFGGTFGATSGFNASDSATVPGANNQISLTYASQFGGVTSTTMDFKSLVSGNLDATGTRDQTFTNDLDIVGQARSVTTPNIGAWENATALPNFNKAGASRTGFTGKTLVTAAAGTKHAIITLVDMSGALAINRTNLKANWWDNATNVAPFGAVINWTTTGTTNASGVFDLPVPNTALTTGQIGTLSITNSDGTTTQSPVGVSFFGPVAVT